MNELGLAELYEVAARATINRRCALVYLHDIRGSMQALFSAVELLGRSAKSSGSNQERVDKAYDLARRAISNHEKSTLGALQALTLQHDEAAVVDVAEVAAAAAHFLRNRAAAQEVMVTALAQDPVRIIAQRAKLQTLLVGLMAEAIDGGPQGMELPVSVDRCGDDAVITIGSEAGFAAIGTTEDLLRRPSGGLLRKELTLLFARQFLGDNGGRLEIDAHASPRGALRLVYPIAT
jgi:hypothetical protein